jgi:hypothetical protein
MIRAVDLGLIRRYTGQPDAVRAALELLDECLDDETGWTALDLAGQMELVSLTLRAPA